MVRHRGGALQGAAVLEIGRDTRRPKGVIADLGLDLGRRCAPADHLVGAGLGEGITTELAGAAPDRLEQPGARLVAQAGALQVVAEVGFEVALLDRGAESGFEPSFKSAGAAEPTPTARGGGRPFKG